MFGCIDKVDKIWYISRTFLGERRDRHTTRHKAKGEETGVLDALSSENYLEYRFLVLQNINERIQHEGFSVRRFPE